jgi:hypothetical protein
VPDDDLHIIAQQAKSAAAEAAVKMNVFQSDNAGETEVAAPQNVREEADVPEPVKRESVKAAAPEEKNISDVVKKWSKK